MGTRLCVGHQGQGLEGVAGLPWVTVLRGSSTEPVAASLATKIQYCNSTKQSLLHLFYTTSIFAPKPRPADVSLNSPLNYFMLKSKSLCFLSLWALHSTASRYPINASVYCALVACPALNISLMAFSDFSYPILADIIQCCTASS